MAATKANSIVMTEGRPLPQIIRFSIPLALTGILQLLFNAADVIVVGKFDSSTALAAVGATTSLINLLIGAFIGISVGVNILVARYLGCRDDERVSRSVHTSVVLGLGLGVVVFLLGFFLASPLLRLMDTPEDVLPLSDRYLQIYFIGVPASLLYNFCAAVLRAFGDTKKPFFFLSISGTVNVLLNLFFVIVCRLGVAGVAIATVVSQYLALALVLICLMRLEGCAQLELKKLRFYPDEALRMIQIGLPAGLQSVIFNISNVMIQSSINSFGADVVAANTAAGHDLYQPESRRGQAGAHQARLPRLHPDGSAHWRADVCVAVFLRPSAARHLYCEGRPCLRLRTCQRHGARNVYGHDVFRLRHHGDVLRHGARTRPKLDADGRDDLRCVRTAHHLDLHDLPDAPHA